MAAYLVWRSLVLTSALSLAPTGASPDGARPAMTHEEPGLASRPAESSVSRAFSPVPPPPPADSTAVVPNDNRARAGRLRSGVLSLDLVARVALWRPEGPRGPLIPIYAFAEEGGAPRIPGPLIRVPEGTQVRLRIRNSLPQPLRLHGLQDRPAGKLDTLDLSPGERRELSFRAGPPGTYLYWGRTARDTFPLGLIEDGQLAGAIVVDSAGAARRPSDRVFVVTLWKARETPPGTPVEGREETLTFNGLAWPHTERHHHIVGDTVRWRVVNASRRLHPLHLHGFYYEIGARGSPLHDTVYAPSARRLVVTERLPSGGTMSMVWTPHTAGNWLFHCHFVEHISARVRLAEHHAVASAGADVNHALMGMSGLVMGIAVKPRAGAALQAPPAPRRSLRLFATERPNVYGAATGYSFVLQEGPAEPAADSLLVPGSPVVLTRGEPVAITVLNRGRAPVAVHWHGIELESYFDGVGGWSGVGARVAPSIAPGDSFIVRMTPPRAGTFIYHTHQHELQQFGGGRYAPLLVLQPGQVRDTVTDRVFVLAAGGPLPSAPPTVNGSATPAPIELRAGTTYRLRFISISPSEAKFVRLIADTVVQRWRPIAKDGADLPANQATVRSARLATATGETWDVEYTPATEQELTLEIVTVGRGLPPVVSRVPVHVRAN